MQSGRIILILAAFLVMASASPAWAPLPLPEPLERFGVPPLPPPVKPRWPRERGTHPLSQHAAADAFRCLALTVYWEAAGEPREGQLAVAHVVLNRVGTPGFADTICGVVHQGGDRFPCQFHWYCTGRERQPRNRAQWAEAQQVARDAMEEDDWTGGALYFHQAAARTYRPLTTYRDVRVIGKHIFYRDRI